MTEQPTEIEQAAAEEIDAEVEHHVEEIEFLEKHIEYHRQRIEDLTEEKFRRFEQAQPEYV